MEALRATFGEQLQLDASLARYTSARIGGMADALLIIQSVDELVGVVSQLWEMGVDFRLLGGGSNVLVSDDGVRGLILLNKARKIRFNEDSDGVVVHAESGANFGVVARQAAQKGYSGLEWAAGIPGTVGGAVFGNAGAHGGDVQGSLLVAEILHPIKGKQSWSLEELEFGYRASALKREAGMAVVLSAVFNLEQASPDSIEEKMASYLVQRRESQPPGASMGSMYKNPTGDYAGRLIDAAGLKGTQIGAAQISTKHGNFFINHGDASATDVLGLIEMAREKVFEEFGVALELEIELVGEWNTNEKESE
ncbi:MAG: UDP-N-acetylmuramate dehydrogenase [Chloroflexi bacterium]|nr:UDP-N-acetylmuramate dehydrogenase [Chloroflexota bacterium]